MTIITYSLRRFGGSSAPSILAAFAGAAIGAMSFAWLGALIAGESRRPAVLAEEIVEPARPEARPRPHFRSARLPGRYAAIVISVIDGDTVEARIAIWLGHEIVTKVRLRGLDAPEIRGACGSERALAVAARDRLRALTEGRAVLLTEIGGDKYFGRVVADLAVDGIDSGAVLLREGLARPYDGGRRQSWCGLAGG